MSLELCILASGSSGNCSLLRTPAGAVLIDIGIGPRACAARLEGTGTQLSHILAVCLTHLDSDHFRPHWASALVKFGIRVFCHASRREDLIRLVHPKWQAALSSLICGFDVEPFRPVEMSSSHEHRLAADAATQSAIGDRQSSIPSALSTPHSALSFSPLPLAHDETGSHGFLIEGFGCRIGYATDLGRVPRHLLDAFINLDILALESNYDPDMQLASSRPWFLKNRIMGGRGHLSNQQCLQAVRAILDRHESAGNKLPAHIVLLHRSRQCNCPALLKNLFETDCRIAPRLTLADQFTRTGWLRRVDVPPAAGEQLTLSFGS